MKLSITIAILIAATTAQAKTQPKTYQEADTRDYQKATMIDCQNVFVEPNLPIHTAKTIPACFYEVKVGDKKLILVIHEGLKPYYVAP
jgi:hypothetical protein